MLSYRLAEYIESEPARKKAQQEAQKAKLDALEKKLGISQDGAGPSSEPLAGKKHRLEDTEYIEQSKDLVDNVKSAVSAGMHFLAPLTVSYVNAFRSTAMLKKKKKAKTGHSSAATSSTSTAEKVAEAVTAVATASSAVAEPILESSATVPVVAVAAVAAGVASA